MYVKKERDVTTFNAVKKVKKILNHKKEDQMLYAYRNAGKLTPEVRKAIREVIDKCKYALRMQDQNQNLQWRYQGKQISIQAKEKRIKNLDDYKVLRK